MTFLTIADVGARTNALTTGEVDWIGRCDLKTLSLLKRDPNVAIAEYTGYGHYVFPMMVRQAALRQCRRPHGAQICDQPRGDHQEDLLRPCQGGQRQPDRALGVKFSIDPQAAVHL